MSGRHGPCIDRGMRHHALVLFLGLLTVSQGCTDAARPGEVTLLFRARLRSFGGGGAPLSVSVVRRRSGEGEMRELWLDRGSCPRRRLIAPLDSYAGLASAPRFGTSVGLDC